MSWWRILAFCTRSFWVFSCNYPFIARSPKIYFWNGLEVNHCSSFWRSKVNIDEKHSFFQSFSSSHMQFIFIDLVDKRRQLLSSLPLGVEDLNHGLVGICLKIFLISSNGLMPLGWHYPKDSICQTSILTSLSNFFACTWGSYCTILWVVLRMITCLIAHQWFFFFNIYVHDSVWPQNHITLAS